jgi:hypothetical protein
MQRWTGTAALPSLRHRARPTQVLLGVGAVLLISAVAAVASASGGGPVRAALFGLALAAGACSVVLARATGLRSSQETFAACAVGIVLVVTGVGGSPLHGGPVLPLALVAVFAGAGLAASSTITWPVAGWLAGQLAVLRALDGVPGAVRTELCLVVALVGLVVALFGRRPVGIAALVTTAPWWVAGVAGGMSDAWTGGALERPLAPVLVVGAVAGLVLARLRRPLEPLLGPPVVVPVVSGVVAGAAVAGTLSWPGGAGTMLTGFAGVILASSAASFLSGWPRGLFLPMAVAGGSTITVLCLVELVASRQWGWLGGLFLLTAEASVLVAVRRADERRTAVPTVVLCLAGGILFALPAEELDAVSTAGLLSALYAVALVVGALCPRDVQRPTAVAVAVCSVAALLLLVMTGERRALAACLIVQGLSTLFWAGLPLCRRRSAGPAGADPGTDEAEEPVSPAWRVGAGQLVVAAWLVAALHGWSRLEAYTVPLAVGLLVAVTPRLLQGRSWPSWGPGLLVAVGPTTVLAVVQPHAGRAAGVLVAAAVVMLAGGWAGLRAPLFVGAGSALPVAVGLAARALSWPVAAAMIVGAVLLWQGMLRERYPVAGFTRRLAELR